MVRLLVIADEELQRSAIIDAALSAHIDRGQIRAVESWQESECALLDPFELAVIDIELWDDRREGGIDLIRHLHDRQPGCKIIALTSKRGGETGIRALEEGRGEFIFTDWKYINWAQLLLEQLKLYKGLVERSQQKKPA